MISIASTKTRVNNNLGVAKKGAKSKSGPLSRNQVITLAIAFGLTAFTVVLLCAVWTYVIAHIM